MRFNYQTPVSKVLTYGKINPKKQPTPAHWPDYPAELGLSEADVPELIRLATDKECQKVPSAWVEVYGQVHGWRALGQLKAAAAAQPLLELLGNEEEDWVTDEIPHVYAMIGAVAIPVLAKYLGRSSKPTWGRMTAVSCLRAIAEAEPGQKSESVAVMVAQLRETRRNPPELNGLLIAELVELKAVETAETIELAYQADAVDELMAGTWASIQVELGLKARSQFSPADFEPKMPPELLEIQRLGRMGAELSDDLADAPFSLSDALIVPEEASGTGSGGNGFGGNGFGHGSSGGSKKQGKQKK
jgi:uncharacterized membrane protein YgcG